MDQAEPGPEYHIDRGTLANGLAHAVVQDRATPVATIIFAVRVGAFAEPPDRDGYTHLLEHMLFKGSSDVPDPLEFRQRLDQLGALRNGTTGVDYMTFHFTVQRAHLRQAVELLANAVREPVFDPTELEREIDVVLAEFDLAESDDASLLNRKVNALLYAENPSRKNPLGTRSVLERATVDALSAMHAEYFLPNNSLLVLAGDVDFGEGKELAERYFHDWDSGALPELGNVEQQVPERTVGAVIERQVSHTTMMVAWLGPDARGDPAELAAGDLLAELSYVSTHEFRSLVAPERYALYAGLEQRRNRFSGAFMAFAATEFDREYGTAAEIVRLLERMRFSFAFTEQQMAEAKAMLRTALLHASGESSSVAFRLVGFWGRGEFEEFDSYLERLEGLTKDDLNQYVWEYIEGRPAVIVALTGNENLSSEMLAAAVAQ